MRFPTAKSSYEVGDTVIVVSNGDEVIYQLNDIFGSIGWRTEDEL